MRFVSKMAAAGLLALLCAGLAGCSGGPSNKVIEEALVGTRPTLSGEEVETVSVIERGATRETAAGVSVYPVRVKLTSGAKLVKLGHLMEVKEVTLDYYFYQDEFDDWKWMQ